MKVKDICNLQNGRAFKPDDWGTEGIPIIRIQNLNDMSAPFNYYAGEYSPVHEINDGELLFSWSGTPGTSFGAFRWNRGKGVLNQHIFKVLPKIDVDKDYLKYALNGNINTIIAKAHGGVGLQHITKKELDEIDVPIVSKKEQLEIVEQLMCIEKIILLRQTELKKLNEIIQARFVKMFGDPIINSKSLPTEKMEERYFLKAGVTTLAESIHEYVTGRYEVPCYGGNGIRGYVKESSYEGEYPIIGRQGALCGNVQYASGKFHATEHAVLVSMVKADNAVWVYYMLKLMDLYRYHTGAAQPGLAVKTLNTVNVIVANRELQEQFADFVAQTEKSKIVCLKILQKTAKFRYINPFL